jgi:lysophospholipase L1-like esterase
VELRFANKKESVMPKLFRRFVSTTALLVLSTACLRAADARPAREKNLIATILPSVGARARETPGKLFLKKGNTIVAIGDSITEAGGYLRMIDAALAEIYPALQFPKIVNTGVSGQKAEDLVGRFEKDVVDRKPTVVTLSVGINDVWHRLGAPHDERVLKTYKENVSKMVDMAQSKGINVILLTPTLITEDPTAEGNIRLVMYMDAMKAIAQEKKCGLADLHGMFLDALKHKPADMKSNWLTSDGVHMSPLGDAVMAAGVLRALGVPERNLSRLK